MTTGGRDLRPCLDKFGNISVKVEIGRGRRSSGSNAKPATVASFLRDLADDVERAGEVRGGRRAVRP